MNNGHMDRGNENPTQHLPWWLRKTTRKPQSGWSAPCVTTEPPPSVKKTLVRLVATGISTRDFPNDSFVRYHGATSHGGEQFLVKWNKWKTLFDFGYNLEKKPFLLIILRQCLLALLHQAESSFCHVTYYLRLRAAVTMFFEYWMIRPLCWSPWRKDSDFTISFVDRFNSSHQHSLFNLFLLAVSSLFLVHFPLDEHLPCYK